MGTVKGFGAFLLSLVRQYGGTKHNLATRVGVSPSQFSRLLTTQAAPTLELCLNLAEATGTSPLVVLRTATLGRVADQLERLFGAPVVQQAGYPLTPIECRHLDQWRLLEARERKAFTVIIDATLEAASPVPVAPRRQAQKVALARRA